MANSWAGSFGFSHDALSRRTQLSRPNGVTTNYSYDKLSHLLSVLHQPSGSTIDGAVYTLDAAGNRTSKADQLAGVTSNYSYDAIYELTGVTQGTTQAADNWGFHHHVPVEISDDCWQIRDHAGGATFEFGLLRNLY